MKDISTSKYVQLRMHKGVVFEQVGLQWRCWADFVTIASEQPRFDSLTAGCRFLGDMKAVR